MPKRDIPCLTCGTTWETDFKTGRAAAAAPANYTTCPRCASTFNSPVAAAQDPEDGLQAHVAKDPPKA